MSSTAASVKAPTVQITVASFDSHFDYSRGEYAPQFRVVRSAPIKDFGRFTDYSPNGGTPLRDATMDMIRYLDGKRSPDTVQIGLLLDESGSMDPNKRSVISGVNEFVGGLAGEQASEGGRVLCVIFTDGFENSSKEVTAEALRQAVAEREADGWTFIYMGANQDAWAEGSANVGISGSVRGQSVNYTSSPVGTQAAFTETARRSRSYLASQEDYDTLSASIGNNAVVNEDGTVTGGTT